MTNLEHVEAEPDQKTSYRMKEELFYPSNNDKMCLLRTLIEEEWFERVIIITNTKYCCENICGYLIADDAHDT